MRHITSILLVVFATVFAQAQDYQILPDTASHTPGAFLMLQGGQYTPFDTATVHQNILEKAQSIDAIETEIALLERLVVLRRQAAQAKQEQNTLLEILKRARICGIKP